MCSPIKVIVDFRRRVAYEIREEVGVTWIWNEKGGVNLEKDRRQSKQSLGNEISNL